jgi:hypothetical protein
VLPLAYSNNNLNLDKIRLQIITEEDPILSMLKCLCEQLIEVEATAKINPSNAYDWAEKKTFQF